MSRKAFRHEKTIQTSNIRINFGAEEREEDSNMIFCLGDIKWLMD